MIKITKEQIIKLADIHIRHYQNLVLAAKNGYNRNVNIGECGIYGTIWLSTKNAIENNRNITNLGKQEIYDALSSGEYDDVVPRASEDFDYQFPC